MVDKLDFTDPSVNLYFARMAIQAYVMATVDRAHFQMLLDTIWQDRKEYHRELFLKRCQSEYGKIKDELYEKFGDLPPEILDLLKITE